MEKDMNVGNNSLYVDVLANDVDFLNMSSQNKYKYIEFNPKVDIENIVFKLWMCFNNAKQFQKAIRNYTIKNAKHVRIN